MSVSEQIAAHLPRLRRFARAVAGSQKSGDAYVVSTLEAILAQRLVRRICSQCMEETAPSREMLADLGMTIEDLAGRKIFHGSGCDACNNSGYKGRVGLFELMVINDDLRDMIVQGASTDELRTAAKSFGMIPLRDSGMQSVYEGITTLDEVVRETILEA